MSAALLTIQEAATACRMSIGFIQAAIRNKELRCVRMGRVRGKRVRPEDLEAFILGKIEGTAESAERETANLAKMHNHMNQWFTARDR